MADAARERNVAAERLVGSLVEGGELMYGVTTGVGGLRSAPSARAGAGDFQWRLIRSHAGGGGAVLTVEVVRAAMAVRVNQIGAGGAGVGEALVDALLGALRAGVTYYVNVDNTGDGRYDIRYEFAFKTKIVNPNSFAAATPTVDSLNDANLNVRQSYTVTREVYKKGKKKSETVVGRNLPVVPSNIGPKTMPNYEALAAQGVKSIAGGGKVFAGQRDDPFFVDLGQTFDSINFRPGVGTGNQGGGKDDLAGYNTNSIVLQVPESQVTRDGKSVAAADSPNAVIGVWSSTERRRLQVTNEIGGAHSKGKFVQVSRLGNPLVNEVVIPLGQKDRFNRTQPQNDAANYGKYVVNPELAKLMNALFNLGVKETGRTDIVTALLTGVKGLTQISAKPAAADTLKINLGVPPTAAGSVRRFGVIAGDNAGFPNGRRLGDDVVDIELRVVGGFLLSEADGGKKLPLGDGVDQNDKPFLGAGPYVAATTAGVA